MTIETLPVSAVVPTRNRAAALARMLESLEAQLLLPAELIVVDGSADGSTREMIGRFADNWKLHCSVRWEAARTLGAAVQRMQGMESATQGFVWFLDDDVIFEPSCVVRLWSALLSKESLGGVNAMITNQRYQTPGAASRLLFRTLAGEKRTSYAGSVIGPALNLLPEDRSDLPEVVPVEWLNLGCTIYRREALPSPLFEPHFTGYSLMEDLALSLVVGRKWQLANARTARIYHDSQRGSHKSSVATMAEMELVNRHFVMTSVLGQRGLKSFAKLLVLELFSLTSVLRSPTGRSSVFETIRGQARATRRILRPPARSAGFGEDR